MDLIGDLFGFGTGDLPIDGFGTNDFLEAFTALNDIVYYVAMLGFSIFMWILQSRGLYTIARRRAIRHPWLSWLPIGRSWVTGCISDQYRYVVRGEVKNKRRWLPILSGLTGVLSLLVVVCTFLGLDPEMKIQAWTTAMLITAGYITLLLLLLAASVLTSVFTYKALYDLYASCDPGKRVLYLLLSIFLNIEAFFVSACRDKDLGMPPRKSQPEPEEPKLFEEPQEPWEMNPEV